jgi:hypothetical protein
MDDLCHILLIDNIFQDDFEVNNEDKWYKIVVVQRTWPCKYEQPYGIPCCHAILAFTF